MHQKVHRAAEVKRSYEREFKYLLCGLFKKHERFPGTIVLVGLNSIVKVKCECINYYCAKVSADD